MPSTTAPIESPDETTDEEDAAQINITEDELAAAAGDLDKIRSSAVSPGSYDSDSITVLEGLDAVRKRPGMYIGSTGERGLHHLVLGGGGQRGRRGAGRLLRHDPRRDPARRAAASGSSTTAAASRSRMHPKEKIPAVTVALTMLHAGGKFGDGGYKVSGGLHGVGVSVVNALSRAASIVDVNRDGYHWTPGLRPRRSRRPRWSGSRRTERDRHHRHLLRQPRDLRDHHLLLRHPRQPVPRDGLPQQGPDDHHRRRATRSHGEDEPSGRTRRTPDTFRYDDGLIDYVQVPHRQQGDGPPDGDRGRGRTARRAAMSLEVAMQWNISYTESRAHLRQHDQHPRGRHPRGGLPRRADQHRQQVGRDLGHDQEAGGPASPATTSARA